MKCHEFEDRLNQLLDDRQSPDGDSQLAAHAAACESCGQLLVGQRLLLSGLRKAVAPPGGQFANGVLARFQSEPVEAVVLEGSLAARRVWQVALWVAATAAALAIAVSIYLSSQPDRPNVVKSRPAPKSIAQVQPQPRAHDLAKANASSPGGRTARSRTGSIQLLPRPIGGYGVAIADMASSLPEAVERIEQVERYAPGIRPIRVSFVMLWDALWRTIPRLGTGELRDEKALLDCLDARRLV